MTNKPPKIIDVGKEFSPRLVNRHRNQGDGAYSGYDFRVKYLNFLDKDTQWKNNSTRIILDFSNVSYIAPSFANEVFGYFTLYEKPEFILDKIKCINLSRVKRLIIELEIEMGYKF